MRTLGLLLAILATLGCSTAPERVRVDLTTEPVALTDKPRAFRPARPVPADNDSVGICVETPAGYDLRDDWTLGPPEGPGARLKAEATLTDGRVVQLPSPSWS